MRFISNQKKSFCALSNGNGFSILEVVMAMCVLSIGVLGVSLMQTTSISTNNTAIRLTDAVAASSDQIEKILTIPYDNLANGEAVNGSYTVLWNVDAAVNNTKNVHIQVSWKDRGKPVSFTHEFIKCPSI